MQRYLGSMEGAVLSGKLTAQALVNSQSLTGDSIASKNNQPQPVANV
jgi:15-cis-phytoene desaturase